MKRWLLILISALGLTGCGYNDFQRLVEQTKSAWSEVLNEYQRRADLVPNIVATVIDTTRTVNAAQLQQLEIKLSAFDQSRGTQIAVLMLPSTQPEDIFSYANRVAHGWEIGRKEIGEGAILDLAAKIIIDEAISPH